MVSERVKRKLEETVNPAERQRKGIWMPSLFSDRDCVLTCMQ